jgi:hypothetical protein
VINESTIRLEIGEDCRRRILSVIAVVSFCVCVFLVGYYYKNFRPYVPQMRAMIQNAPPLYRDPPPVFLHAMAVTSSEQDIKNWVTFRLLCEFNKPSRQGFKTILNEIIWFHLLELEFSDDEWLTIWYLNIHY